jgi:protein involved in polysaccharide export with SLBB domain
MRNYLLFFLLLSFIGASNFGYSQVKKVPSNSLANMSGTSEAQLFQMWRNASSMGMSESEILKLFTQMGVNGSQYLQLKKRFEKKVEDTSEADLEEEAEDLNASMGDSSLSKQMPTRRTSPIFGIRFFSNAKNTFSPNLKLAAPKNYILGPDDQLQLILTGNNESTQMLKINANGFINIKYAGIVTLSGLTLEQAQLVIAKKMKPYYPNLADGKTTLTILLTKYRTIRVTIAGEAYKPGTYQVPGVLSVFNLLYITGGPTEKGSLRNIQLIRNSKKIAEIDFYQFLLSGTFNDNIKIEDQDVIYFPFYEKHVSLTGAIKRPSIYELKNNETLADLFTMAGGFGDTAYKERVKVFQYGTSQRVIKDILVKDFSTYLPKNADSVFADKINDSYANKLYIGGAVTMPGNYELTSQLTLKQLIEKAGGVKESAYLLRGYINRVSKDLQKQMVHFNLTELQTRKELDIPLNKDDSVYIPFLENLREQKLVQVEGAVKNQGNYEFREGMQLEDVLLLAGGFNNKADNRKIEVLRYAKKSKDSLTAVVLDSYHFSVAQNLTDSKTGFVLQDKDKIIVASLLNEESIGVVKLGGEVLYPGTFSISNREETAAQLIARAGGLNAYANLSQIKIYRSGMLVGIDLKDNSYRVKANDSIYIPKTETLVEVTGAVYNQQFVPYSNGSLRYYVSEAGGLTDKAILKKAYVQYSNGLNKKTKHFLFFRSFPTVLPGSKIIIPAGEAAINKLITSNTISSVLASVTTLVSILVLLKK